jgi:excisionase family DNA binding protein
LPTILGMAPRLTSSLEVTQAEAAYILGCHPTTVHRLVAQGVLGWEPGRHRQLSREDVERLAVQRWRRRDPDAPDDGVSYWVTAKQAGEILGVGRTRVGQLVESERLPCVRTSRGERLFRRAQVEVIANARLSRRLTASR